MFHDFDCFNQSCDQQLELCGEGKIEKHFAEVLRLLGDKHIEYYEHAEVTYVKSDLKKVC